MKNIIIISVIAIIIAFLPSFVFAWDDCPFGLINDPYPGSCARYVDTNNDKICDHSQSEPGQLSNKGNVGTTRPNYYFWPITIILILFYISFFYLEYRSRQEQSKFWQMFKKDNLIYFHNIILLLFFLLSIITGFGLLLKITLGWFQDYNFSKAHIIFSIIMAEMCFVHVILHWKYFIDRIRRFINS